MKPIIVEYWPLTKLIAYARNPRNNDSAMDRMAASIQEFGFRIPVLARGSGEIVDGHLRLKAARKLGMTELPVIICDDWTEAQVKAFRLMVNRSATWANWDETLLAQELDDLRQLGTDLSLTGFDWAEINQLLLSVPGPLADPDAIPTTEPESVSCPGDLWICGSHHVLCGDSTVPEQVERLLSGVRPMLMVTDPPYGVEYDPGWRERAGLGRQRQTGKVAGDDRMDWSAAYQLFSGDVSYVWHAGVHAAPVAASLEAAGFEIRSQIIWAKQHFALSRGNYHWQHEPCWYAVRRGASAHWCGDRKQSTLWEVANLNPFGGNEQETATGHGTQKPVELIRRPVLNHTQPGEAVYDPFMGSGTVLIAAELTGRSAFGIEIEPCYVDIAVRRWQSFTGRPAQLAGSNASFAEVQASRQRKVA